MREFKFRAWSNKFKRMFRVSEISMSRDGYVHGIVDAGFSNEYFQYLTDEERKSPLNFIGRVDFVKSLDGRTAGLFQDPTDDPFYLMQYTGLNDKNGKEIYEGDIVKIGDYPTYEVTINEFTQVHVIDNEMGMEELWKNHKVCKVIGNIYENPELLEE